MSAAPIPSAANTVWTQSTGSTSTAPSITTPIPPSRPGNLPRVDNPNLPPNTLSNINSFAASAPQTAGAPFSPLQQPFNPANSFISNIYATPHTLPSLNAIEASLVSNAIQRTQNDINQRRITHLEEESTQRRNAISSLRQIGHQLLEGQTYIQEQVLEYQFMLQHCLNSLDHQSFILTGQSEDIAFLQAKMQQYEYLIDALRRSRERTQLQRNPPSGSNVIDNKFLCQPNPLLSQPPPMSSFLRGSVTRVTSSKFQPFNPGHPSSNESRNKTLSAPNSRLI